MVNFLDAQGGIQTHDPGESALKKRSILPYHPSLHRSTLSILGFIFSDGHVSKCPENCSVQATCLLNST